MTPQPESPEDEQLLASIERYGWGYMFISPSEGEPDPDLHWGFTIGLNTSLNHPDILVFDPRYEASHAIVAGAIELIEDGERLAPGREYDEIVVDYGIRFLDVDPKWYDAFVGYAQWFYESPDDFGFVQLVMQDRLHRYPWEPGSELAGNHPLLVSDEDARALGLDA